MASFSQDNKWLEAKRAVGYLNWIEVIAYYRSIGGDKVFVYSVVDGDKRLIIDILADDSVLLLNSVGRMVTDSYENVLNSRKVFKYSETSETQTYAFKDTEYEIIVERHI